MLEDSNTLAWEDTPVRLPCKLCLCHAVDMTYPGHMLSERYRCSYHRAEDNRYWMTVCTNLRPSIRRQLGASWISICPSTAAPQTFRARQVRPKAEMASLHQDTPTQARGQRITPHQFIVSKEKSCSPSNVPEYQQLSCHHDRTLHQKTWNPSLGLLCQPKRRIVQGCNTVCAPSPKKIVSSVSHGTRSPVSSEVQRNPRQCKATGTLLCALQL